MDRVKFKTIYIKSTKHIAALQRILAQRKLYSETDSMKEWQIMETRPEFSEGDPQEIYESKVVASISWNLK